MILKDRISSINYKIEISSGQILLTSTSDTENSEPIFKDFTQEKYWKLFISDGSLGFEESESAVNQVVHLWDTDTTQHYILLIDDGNFGMYLFSGFIVRFCSIYTKGFIDMKVKTL